MAAASSGQLLHRVYQHVVLPRQVPDKEDEMMEQVDAQILNRLIAAVKQLLPHIPSVDQKLFDSVRLTLQTAKAINVGGRVVKDKLVKELNDLSGNHALVLWITEQNAALNVYQKFGTASDDQSIIFEVFEASASCNEVLATENALLWDFPGQAVEIPIEVATDTGFQEALAAFIEQASVEKVHHFAAVTFKASAKLPEVRDTSEPTLISGMVMELLRASGSDCSTRVLRKRVRDTVSFLEARKPWRRSPFYLVVRVAIQRQLYRLFGAGVGRLYYKLTMCVFLSGVLEDSLGLIPDEASFYMKMKLGHRLGKLETDKNEDEVVSRCHAQIMRSLDRVFTNVLKRTGHQLEKNIEEFKNHTRRQIRALPNIARPSDLNLQLPVSGAFLEEVLRKPLVGRRMRTQSPRELLERHMALKVVSQPLLILAKDFFELFEFEADTVLPAITGSGLPADPNTRCIELARILQLYIEKAGTILDEYASLKSRMLLTMMELWVKLDDEATEAFSLLKEYHPAFHPSMLDTLQLLSYEDMVRLKDIHRYLCRRVKGWSGTGSKTIFDPPKPDCFAARYYDSNDSLADLRHDIEASAELKRDEKRHEWLILSKRHEALMHELAQTECEHERLLDEEGGWRTRHKKDCPFHTVRRKARQIIISIHEHPLPSYEPEIKAAIFELVCPKSFALYRDATWSMLSTFAYQHERPVQRASDYLEYDGIQEYVRSKIDPSVSLASSKKSHLECHYKELGFPVEFGDVCRSCGLRLAYYDKCTKTWTSRSEHPTFSRLFSLILPQSSPFQHLDLAHDKWPSSNRILANQSECPAEVNVHEFVSWQGLLVGTHTRWANLLRELASTNLNFSSDSTWVLVTRVALEVGPSSASDVLRDAHAVFDDDLFCQKLLLMVRNRVLAISENWREPVQMDILITIMLKIISVASSQERRSEATELLMSVRQITMKWSLSLQQMDYEVSDGLKIFSLWAALLCKRTFHFEFEHAHHFTTNSLCHYIKASIALHENLRNLVDLPFHLQNIIVDDMMRIVRAFDRIQSLIINNGHVFLSAVNEVWPVPVECLVTPVQLRSASEEPHWIELVLDGQQGTHARVIQYNILVGTLLIDGFQLGNIPTEYRKWPIIEELFGKHIPRVYRSSLPGMSFSFNKSLPYGHRLHVGFRGNTLVVRAQQRDTVLELVFREKFGNNLLWDIPHPLIGKCYHWLDLKTGVLEIRVSDPWKSKPGNWRLDVCNRRAVRRFSTLVDPYSRLHRSIVSHFEYFDFPYNIVVYQPQRGHVQVSLKRLELDFFVTSAGLLQCRQLSCFIDPNQDAGTWYGLLSKIVLKPNSNIGQRSILVPTGRPFFKRQGEYVKSMIHNDGGYMKFAINDVLGRLECPAEPRLLHTKAYWHAHTAQFTDDPLTGRTGQEEALFLLASGSYQPWEPLLPSNIDYLLRFAQLTPCRSFYPTDLKCMEITYWNPILTTYMQDDRYRRLIQVIIQKSSDLTRFSPRNEDCLFDHGASGNPHLENRSLSRIYSRDSVKDLVYQSRDGYLPDAERQHVFEVCITLSKWPSRIGCMPSIAPFLQNSKCIGGYDRIFDKFQVTDLLATDLGTEWGPLARTFIEANERDKYRLMFLVGPIALSIGADMQYLRVLLALGLLSELKELKFPDCSSFIRFQIDEKPDLKTLADVMGDAKTAFDPTKHKLERGQLGLARMSHDKQARLELERLAESMISQWPSRFMNITKLAQMDAAVVNQNEALSLVSSEWSRLTGNFELLEHLRQLELALRRHGEKAAESFDPTSYYILCRRQKSSATSCTHYATRSRHGDLPKLSDLMRRPMVLDTDNDVNVPREQDVALTMNTTKPLRPKVKKPGLLQHAHELRAIVEPFQSSASKMQQRFAHELTQSVNSFIEYLEKPEQDLEPFNPMLLQQQIKRAAASFGELYASICDSLRKADPQSKWLDFANLWPKMTPFTLLQQLSTSAAVTWGPNAKEALVKLGLALTAYQRSLRIQNAALGNRKQRIVQERENIGHQNWCPLEHTDWLLLEIDSNALLRPDQVDVARATIAPESNHNSVTQILMGKGKTSFILPMVALSLANRENLCRIVVPRALLLQSAQVLQAKLGGMLGRAVVHVPFSRRTEVDPKKIKTYCSLHNHVRDNRGILITLPEHLLSFKLSGLQHLCDDKILEGRMMIKAQRWLSEHARDVLDECDVSLGIRTQLIYPSGSQMPVDGHPMRWQSIQTVLRLARSHAVGLAKRFPSSLEVVERIHEGYPLIYFLRKDVEASLLQEMVDAICHGCTSIISCTEYSRSERAGLREFLTFPLVSRDTDKIVSSMLRGKPHLHKIFHLLRGLLVHRILLSTLKKRWNVQYGLNPNREPIAVPYLAKGVPSLTSEWGHPDVAIMLTCLSFYYEGLNIQQLKQAFEHLMKANEPGAEYETWMTPGFPSNLRDYRAINVEDVSQLVQLHARVRYNTSVLDFYMNNFVFPKYAKQFEWKLQASGWDLIQHDPTRPMKPRTTGFSGTNDTRHQLPLSIKQEDLPSLAHTNAEVLSYLLQERNKAYTLAVDRKGRRLTEEGLLHHLHDQSLITKHHSEKRRQPIRLLIDAGAQILEHTNEDLVKAWLQIDTEPPAAIFFDRHHRPTVLYRGGSSAPLTATPFAEDLEQCLVYLDESHCRGTDLKLPVNAKAALTLGQHVTKDSLTQAAMRLRLLGESQSVVFYSPPEVHQSILDLGRYSETYRPDSADVIRWLLDQTCKGIEQLEPLYYMQGTNYVDRTQAALDQPRFYDDAFQQRQYMSVVRSREMHTLEELYGRKEKNGYTKNTDSYNPALRRFMNTLRQRKLDFHDSGVAVHSSCLEEVEVEQEREIEFEREAVKDPQEAIHFNALRFLTIHKDLAAFARTGCLAVGSDAYQPMPSVLQATALGSKYEDLLATLETSKLYVSKQFTRTIALRGQEPNDNFLRPCQWILYGRRHEIAIIVSPEEANCLIPILRSAHKAVSGQPDNSSDTSSGVHLIVYAAPITRRMLHFNNLDFYAIPSLPPCFQVSGMIKIELGIFAGRLYFDWEEYGQILAYLGIQYAEPESHGQSAKAALAKKFITFLHDWLAVRRKGQDFEQTPMGFITTGKPLTADHPFFVSTEEDEEIKPRPAGSSSPQAMVESDTDEDDDVEEFFDAEEGGDLGDSAEFVIVESDDEEDAPFKHGDYVEEVVQEKE